MSSQPLPRQATATARDDARARHRSAAPRTHAPPQTYDVLIVGAGQGGARAATALRQAGFAGSIALLGSEPEPPYERPPLSKDYLAGDKQFDRLLIHAVSFWADHEISLISGCLVTAVDAGRHLVRTAEGAEIGYGHLVWATGGVPRILSCPGHDLIGVHTLRTRADADRIRDELASAARVVIVGGGYIGLEAAAVFTAANQQVTVIEAESRVLARVAGEPISRYYEQEHRAHGVDIRLEATVESIEETQGRVSGVRLADGDFLACDIVLVVRQRFSW